MQARRSLPFLGGIGVEKLLAAPETGALTPQIILAVLEIWKRTLCAEADRLEDEADTPLHLACCYQQLQTVELLLQVGTKPNLDPFGLWAGLAFGTDQHWDTRRIPRLKMSMSSTSISFHSGDS